ncbi:hypothetical protein, partial [Campylobacter aviculae]
NKIKFAPMKIQANKLRKVKNKKQEWEQVILGGKARKNEIIPVAFRKNSKIESIITILSGSWISEENKRKQLTKNKRKGQEFEEKDFKAFKKECPSAQSQVTLRVYYKNKPIVKTRVDAMAYCNNKFIIREAKSSSSAPLTPNQKIAFDLISQKNDSVQIGLRGNKILKYNNKILQNGDKISSKDVIIKISRPSGVKDYRGNYI